MDVRAKQRLCLVSCPLNLNGLGGGFAPRHLNRWAFLGEIKICVNEVNTDTFTF